MKYADTTSQTLLKVQFFTKYMIAQVIVKVNNIFRIYRDSFYGVKDEK